MTFREWLPRSLRNRIGFGLAVLSLVLLVVWNLLPNYEYGEVASNGCVGRHVWPEVIKELSNFPAGGSFDFKEIMNKVCVIALVFMLLVTLLQLPLWTWWRKSLLLRIIPCGVFALAGVFVLILMMDEIDFYWNRAPKCTLLTMILIVSNFLAAAFSFAFMTHEASDYDPR
jgi:hypothetical protein